MTEKTVKKSLKFHHKTCEIFSRFTHWNSAKSHPIQYLKRSFFSRFSDTFCCFLMCYLLFFSCIIHCFFHLLFAVFFMHYSLFFSLIICCFFHTLFVVFFMRYLLLFSLVICCFFHALFTVFLMKKSMECYIISQLCIRMYQQYSMGAWGNQETERHWGECQVWESIWELWFRCCQVWQYLRCAWGACWHRCLLSTCGCYTWALRAVGRQGQVSCPSSPLRRGKMQWWAWTCQHGRRESRLRC